MRDLAFDRKKRSLIRLRDRVRDDRNTSFRDDSMRRCIKETRHSGVGQNQVKTITYWMLAYASMTENVLNQSSLTIKMTTK